MTNPNKNDGKRKYPRIPLAVEMRCANRTRPFTCVTRNVSIGGVYIESGQIFPVGAAVELQCRLPYAHGELRLRGKVVRHNQEAETGLVDGMAIEFVDLRETEKKSLAEYIHNTLPPGEGRSS